MSLAFEWDEHKVEQNLKKHGVSFGEASTVFGDPLARTISDPLHSGKEVRLILLGESWQRRLLVVVLTDCGDKIRIISARVATRCERKDHERASQG